MSSKIKSHNEWATAQVNVSTRFVAFAGEPQILAIEVQISFDWYHRIVVKMQSDEIRRNGSGGWSAADIDRAVSRRDAILALPESWWRMWDARTSEASPIFGVFYGAEVEMNVDLAYEHTFDARAAKLKAFGKAFFKAEGPCDYQRLMTALKKLGVQNFPTETHGARETSRCHFAGGFKSFLNSPEMFRALADAAEQKQEREQRSRAAVPVPVPVPYLPETTVSVAGGV